MADDRWKALETHKDAMPGPWHVNEYIVRDAMGEFVADARTDAAAHIARWSPDVTAEIVELLRERYVIAMVSSDPLSRGFCCRMDALLDRVGGTRCGS